MRHRTPSCRRPAAVPPRGRRAALALLALTGSGLLAACAAGGPPPGTVAVTPFELQRYQGRWYEIARLDHGFERGLSDVSAFYTPQPDGSVEVINRGFDAAAGRWREARGRALPTAGPATGSLKVSFFGPFYGGYHVVALDPDYQWALVLGADRDYCWILARTRQLAPAQREAILARARAAGIATEALIWVGQDRQDPGR
jgi:apolipoprotein D and lipocalin family protein